MLYGGGSITAKRRTVCIVEARSNLQNLEARVCVAEAHGVRGLPPSHNIVKLKKDNTKFYVLMVGTGGTVGKCKLQ